MDYYLGVVSAHPGVSGAALVLPSREDQHPALFRAWKLPDGSAFAAGAAGVQRAVMMLGGSGEPITLRTVYGWLADERTREHRGIRIPEHVQIELFAWGPHDTCAMRRAQAEAYKAATGMNAPW